VTPAQIPKGTVARWADGELTLTTPDGKQWRYDGEKYNEIPPGLSDANSGCD